MVDKILFYPWFGVEVREPMSVTPKGGWAPIPMGYQRLVAEFKPNESIAVDKTCWDWTMPAWVIRGYVDVKKAQCVDWTPEYEWVVWRRLWFVLGPGTVFNMSDGVCWRQTYWGQMKSGWLLTLSMNSIAQHLQHVLAWGRGGLMGTPSRMWAMGDDTLARFSGDDDELDKYERALATTGCLMKKILRRREFAGFEFISKPGGVVARPLYPDKHQFVLKYLDPRYEQDILMSYSLLYALDDDTWFKAYHPLCDFAVGPMQRMWAKGLADLKLLGHIPACFLP